MNSMPSSSASPRARRPGWIPSSGCCSKSPGRHWKTRVSPRRRSAGTQTAVFVGLTTNDYYYLALGGQSRPEDIDPYIPFGNAPNFAAGRLAYFLGVHGPAVVDRHRVFVVAGGGASGVPEPATPGERPWRWPPGST